VQKNVCSSSRIKFNISGDFRGKKTFQRALKLASVRTIQLILQQMGVAKSFRINTNAWSIDIFALRRNLGIWH